MRPVCNGEMGTTRETASYNLHNIFSSKNMYGFHTIGTTFFLFCYFCNLNKVCSSIPHSRFYSFCNTNKRLFVSCHIIIFAAVYADRPEHYY